jgi:uncharacterized membrane protein YcaP (DUF421 family)
MEQIVGHAANLGWVAAKAALLFLTAVAGFRIAERRTLAEMGAFDFVAAVACGAIVGRVPNSSTTSYVEGAVTLITILVVHALLARLRMNRLFAGLIDHKPRILIAKGAIDQDALKRSGLTDGDLFAILRSHDVHQLSEVRYLVFEQRGMISLVRERDGALQDPLLPSEAVNAPARAAR